VQGQLPVLSASVLRGDRNRLVRLRAYRRGGGKEERNGEGFLPNCPTSRWEGGKGKGRRHTATDYSAAVVTVAYSRGQKKEGKRGNAEVTVRATRGSIV